MKTKHLLCTINSPIETAFTGVLSYTKIQFEEKLLSVENNILTFLNKVFKL